jgi:hypothetical protein
MRFTLLLCALSLLLTSPAARAASPAKFPDAVNALLGDASFVWRFGRMPGAGDDEGLRITTHLRFVHRLLSVRDVSALSPAQRAARAQNLAHLADYIAAGAYPRNTEHPGRRPRFIDDRGQICAAGYLIEKAAGRAFAEAMNRRFESAYVLDMSDPKLARWIAQSGLTAAEVAMIQPSYGFQPPLPVVGAPAQEELRRALARARPALERCSAAHQFPRRRPGRLNVVARLISTGEHRLVLRSQERMVPAFESCARRAIEREVLPLRRGFSGAAVTAQRTFVLRVAPFDRTAAQQLLLSRLPNLVQCAAQSAQRGLGSFTVSVDFLPGGGIGRISTIVPKGELAVASCMRQVLSSLAAPASFRGRPLRAQLHFSASLSTPPAT